MKFIQQLLYFNTILFAIVSCKQEKICPPDNIAPIQTNYFKSGLVENKPGIGNNIYFSAPKLKDARYFWDFGDGEVSTRRNPRKSFSQKGNYIVKLRIEQGENECFGAREIDMQTPLEIGSGLFIKTITVHSINFTKEDGNPWDTDRTGPDIFLKLGEVFTSTVIENFSKANLPYQWDLSEYNIPYDAYQLEIIDTDSDISVNSEEAINACNLESFELNGANNLTFNDTEQSLDIEITYIIKDSI